MNENSDEITNLPPEIAKIVNKKDCDHSYSIEYSKNIVKEKESHLYPMDSYSRYRENLYYDPDITKNLMSNLLGYIQNYIVDREKINKCIVELRDWCGDYSFLDEDRLKRILNNNIPAKKLVDYYIKNNSK